MKKTIKELKAIDNRLSLSLDMLIKECEQLTAPQFDKIYNKLWDAKKAISKVLDELE